MAHGYNNSIEPTLLIVDSNRWEGDNENIKKITSILIDTSDIPAAGVQKRFTVSGEVGAEFMLSLIHI